MVGSVTLQQIRYLAVLAEEKHFGRAAERLAIAQPSLSQQIARVEQLVGFDVVVRKPEFSLTPAGMALLEAVQPMPERIRAAVAQAQRVAAGSAGALTIGFAGSVMLSKVAQIFRAFRQSYPDVSVKLTEAPTATQLTQLARGDLDLAIVRQPQIPREIDGLKLVKERFVLAVPASHRLARKSEVQLAQVKEEPFVFFPRSVTPGLHDQIARLFARSGFVPNVVQEATEWLTILGLIDAGAGISLVPESFRKLRWGGVRYLDLEPENVQTEIVLCWRIDDISPPAQNYIKTAKREIKRKLT